MRNKKLNLSENPSNSAHQTIDPVIAEPSTTKAGFAEFKNSALKKKQRVLKRWRTIVSKLLIHSQTKKNVE